MVGVPRAERLAAPQQEAIHYDLQFSAEHTPSVPYASPTRESRQLQYEYADQRCRSSYVQETPLANAKKQTCNSPLRCHCSSILLLLTD